ncbi:putative ABC transporter [Staphylococcus piscifermentans]|uniref:Antibiotic ABC transporter permease n=1 Tax=Staphylococcus piscifermentans TaxID=70258 RepID=A0A239TKI6_9STAP|nr:ABC transporter permease [Staphylococcus piscifermentans]RTX86217.1 ABC transporter permease [Staphylococcus piscifermentans]GEP84848.1 antibiotic ABC transporter permease [Staphylococcus piscifermentans]SNU98230.1 putative ABC transporter [Staphylococcus piscifermentans]
MRFKAILVRVITDLFRDKRTLALMFIVPLLILTIMYFLFNSDTDEHLKVGFADNVPDRIVKALPDDKADTSKYHDVGSIQSLIEKKDLDAFVAKKGNQLEVTYTNEDPSKTNAVKQMLNGALQKTKMQSVMTQVDKMKTQMERMPGATGKNDTQFSDKGMSLKSHYLYGNADSTYFDKMFPILMGFFVFLFVFLISGIALLRERTTGTLERILATSVKRSEIVFGYLVGYGIFAIIQTLIIVLFSVYLLKVEMAGNLGWVLLINILVAFAALAMGLFVSTFANSEFQMLQFIPIVVVPQVLFSGIIPLDNVNRWIASIGYLFPLRYAGNALTEIMVKAEGISHFWLDICILLLFIIIFTVLNIVGLKRYRKV